MKSQIQLITSFISNTLNKTGKSNIIIGVSGGIDSATALTLCTQAIGKENVYPILLPYGDQDILDGMEICRHNLIPVDNIQVINIKPMTDVFLQDLVNTRHPDPNEIRDQNQTPLSDSEPNLQSPQNNIEKVRIGNIMARVRMIILFDQAKKLNALVCGTENKSEKYLGYFTRFGDEASDIEPIQHMYKTQVWALAKELGVPQHLIDKAPTAGLWQNQTDENELGFSYHEADLVLQQYIDQKKKANEIKGGSNEVIERVLKQVENQRFKQEVPYHI